MSSKSECCICGTIITDSFFVCASCAVDLAIPHRRKDWPPWLKFMAADERRRRTDARDPDRELCSSDAPEYDRIVYGEYIDEFEYSGN